MGSLRLALCAGSVAAAVLVPAFAPCAHAGDGGISVTPASPVPGTDIQVRAQGCTGTTGTAASEAFVADARLTGKPGALTGETRVRSTLDPGTYDVRVTCDGFEDKVRGTFTVVDKDQKKKDQKKRDQEKKDQKKRDQEKQDQKKRDQEKQEQKEKDQEEQREQGKQEKKERDTVAPAAPASPVAPVQAGGGGTARLAAAEARSEGPDTRHVVVGLVLAAVAAVAVAVSSARRGRGRAD